MISDNFDKKKIEELCRKHGLKLLVLHGSYAKGTNTPKSDIDIGMLFDRKIERRNYFDILGDFGEIFGDKFDPALLNNAESMICYHVAMEGYPLFELSKGDFAEFKVQSIGRYMDAKKFRDLEKSYIKHAVGRDS